MQGDEVVRMVPYKDGKANHGHSCVKGRFAWGYATHKDRITKPMIRAKITDPWREVTWDEAIDHAASEFKRIQAKYGRDSIGGITSSRCTNEETYLVQKLIRAALRQQQRRYLRARLPFADRLRPEDRRSAPRPARRISSRSMQADVIMVIGANPTDAPSGLRLAHEAAAARGRQADRHRSAPDRPGAHAPCRGRLPPAAAARHQRRDHQRDRRMSSSPKAWSTRHSCASAATWPISSSWRAFHRRPDATRRKRSSRSPAFRPPSVRAAARLYATGGNGAIYYGLGVTEHSQGSTMVMGMANLAMATGNSAATASA